MIEGVAFHTRRAMRDRISGHDSRDYFSPLKLGCAARGETDSLAHAVIAILEPYLPSERLLERFLLCYLHILAVWRFMGSTYIFGVSWSVTAAYLLAFLIASDAKINGKTMLDFK